MSNAAQRHIHTMIDNATDTVSWGELARELDRCAAEVTPDESATQTLEITQSIEMLDLLKTLDQTKS